MGTLEEPGQGFTPKEDPLLHAGSRAAAPRRAGVQSPAELPWPTGVLIPSKIRPFRCVEI